MPDKAVFPQTVGISPREVCVHKGGIGSHTKPNQGDTNTWLTPEYIIKALGPFELDPCAAPSPRPWPTAEFHIELPEDGLAVNWNIPVASWAAAGPLGWPTKHQLTFTERPARVWLNPPYGKETDQWLKKMCTHRNGIALIFARTETATWQWWVWPYAHAIFFFDGRLFFHHPDGTRGKSNAGGPSALISYSEKDTIAIQESGLKGQLVRQWSRRG